MSTSNNSNHRPNQLGQQTHQKATIKKQNAISVTLTPDSTNDPARKTFVQYQAVNYQPPMLNTQVAHEPACRSASSSPWITRRVQNNQPDARLESGITYSLNVPSNSVSRKLSLQPVVGQQVLPHLQHPHPMNDYLAGLLHQQQGPVLKNVVFYQNIASGGGSGAGGGIAASSGANNLAVSNQHIAPRRSIIGRLERSSFQAQRLSDVGVAVGQQITAKMGLKIPASQERIVEQTRWLYLRYVFVKLRQNRLPLRDLNLSKSSRARRAAALGEPPKISCSAPASATVILEPSSTVTFGQKTSTRKRATLISSDGIDSSELNLLAAKVHARDLKGGPKSSGNIASDVPMGASDTSNGTATNSTTLGNKKYIMDPAINNQILTVILDIIREFRELKPEFYGDTIHELIGIDKFTSVQTLLDVQMTICQEMTRSEISWCRISALFSLFGAMSLDCVRLGAPEHVGPILDGFIEFVERDLAFWISQQGGWENFLYKYRAGYRLRHMTTKMIIVALPLLVWALFSFFR